MSVFNIDPNSHELAIFPFICADTDYKRNGHDSGSSHNLWVVELRLDYLKRLLGEKERKKGWALMASRLVGGVEDDVVLYGEDGSTKEDQRVTQTPLTASVVRSVIQNTILY